MTSTVPSVIERVNGLVAVRVNTDDSVERNGYRGVELAARYRVRGTPTLLLLDEAGQVLGTTSGFSTPRQLHAWLDQSMARVASGGRASGFSASGS